jgi:hypothetical protein
MFAIFSKNGKYLPGQSGLMQPAGLVHWYSRTEDISLTGLTHSSPGGQNGNYKRRYFTTWIDTLLPFKTK